MNPANARNERDALRSQALFQRNIIYGLITLALLLGGGWGWTALHPTVAIVPPEVRRPYEIGANYANKDYLADVGAYVLQQVLTVSPDSVDYNNRIILKMTHPDGYGPLKASLEAAAQRLKRDRVTTVWVPRKETVSERDKTVKVAGVLKTYIADVLTSQRDREYLVSFEITSSGRLYVLKVLEVDKSDRSGTAGADPRV